MVDYPAVALDVAAYGQASFRRWKELQGDGWRDEMHKKGLRWDHAWDAASVDPFTSLDEWLAEKPQVRACRASLSWPPKGGAVEASDR